MKVPPLDLQTQYQSMRDEVLSAVHAVLDSQLCCNGPAVRELESQVAAYCRCAHALGVSSGTDALLCSLMALGIGAGDEVITTPFTFFGTAGSIWRTGARPVFVDIEPAGFNLDVSRLAAAVTERTRAIMPVHLFGQMADMEAVMAVADRHKLHVVEDAAQAIGAERNGRRAGAIGTAGCLSFYPTKNLGAMGDAGMILTQDAALAEVMGQIRLHGQTGIYIHKYVGGNFRMDSLQAAVLSVKLRRLDAWTARRREIAALYDELLAEVDEVTTPVVLPGNTHIYHQYVIRAGRRDALQAHLKAEGVFSGIFYPLGLHLQECFAALGHKKGDFLVTEQATAEVLALPIYAELRDEQVRYVAEQIKAFYA